MVDELSCQASFDLWSTARVPTPAATHSLSTGSGCRHSLVIRALLKVIDEIGIRGQVISVAGIGCHAIRLFGTKLDMTTGAHGLAPVIATSLKHAHVTML